MLPTFLHTNGSVILITAFTNKDIIKFSAVIPNNFLNFVKFIL